MHVGRAIPGFADLTIHGPFDTPVRAGWDRNERTLTYVSDIAYNGCLAEGTATLSVAGVLRLVVVPDDGDGQVCTMEARRVAVVVEDVEAAPTRLVVSEHGADRQVPVTVLWA